MTCGTGALLFENDPLSAICSTVCDHEVQCAGNCVLGKKWRRKGKVWS